jgi:nucleotide-binding universal stress UspA family protein
MLDVHTILFPTDFSETANQAFPLACSLAHDCGARLVVLYVMLPILSPETIRAEQHPEDYYGIGASRLHQLRAPDEDVRVEHRLEAGNPVRVILNVAEESGAGLIILGTQGKTGLERVLLGSVAEEVLRKAACPILTVRASRPAEKTRPPELATTSPAPIRGARS